MTRHDQHCYCRRTWPEWLRRNTSLLRCFCFPWPATVTVGGHDLSDCEETHHLVLNLNISFYIPRLSQIPARKSKCKFRYSSYSLLHYLVCILFLIFVLLIFRGVASQFKARHELYCILVCQNTAFRNAFSMLYLIWCFETAALMEKSDIPLILFNLFELELQDVLRFWNVCGIETTRETLTAF